jgi:hypothetical protein
MGISNNKRKSRLSFEENKCDGSLHTYREVSTRELTTSRFIIQNSTLPTTRRIETEVEA